MTENLQESWLLPTERASAVKTRMNGLSCGEKKSWQYVQPFWYNTSVWQTDRRTDRIWIAKTCFELLRGWCTWKWMFIFHFSVFIWLEMRINGRLHGPRSRVCWSQSTVALSWQHVISIDWSTRRVSEISPVLSYPTSVRRPRRGWPSRNFAKISKHTKLEWMGYCAVKKSWRYVEPFWYNTSVWRTDGQTDGQTHVQPISISCFSIADARKNNNNMETAVFVNEIIRYLNTNNNDCFFRCKSVWYSTDNLFRNDGKIYFFVYFALPNICVRLEFRPVFLLTTAFCQVLLVFWEFKLCYE